MSKFIARRIVNRLFHWAARNCPGSTGLRPLLHRARGVAIGHNVFIGDDVYLDNEYPECIEIRDHVQISIRAIIVAHTRGPGRVVLGKASFLGPNSVIVCGAGKVLTVGEGAVIGAGAVVTRSVPAHLFIAPPPAKPTARVGVPLPLAKSMEEFWTGLAPLRPEGSGVNPATATER